MKQYEQQSSTERKTIYQLVNAPIIKLLENGHVMWRAPWVGSTMPMNIINGNVYSSLNPFILNWFCLTGEYQQPLFLTFKQAEDKGGYVRKGESGVKVIKWDSKQITNTKKTIYNVSTGMKDYAKTTLYIPYLISVFNIEQTKNVKVTRTNPPYKTEEEKRNACAAILKGMRNCPDIVNLGNRAGYYPTMDKIYLPTLSNLNTDTAEYYYLFYCLACATGHPNRLNRTAPKEPTLYDSPAYDINTLIAELTASYLCAVTGIEQPPVLDTDQYCRKWIAAINADSKILITAATQAKAAAHYILGTVTNQQDSQ